MQKLQRCSLAMKAKKTTEFISGNILLTEFWIISDGAQTGVHYSWVPGYQILCYGA